MKKTIGLLGLTLVSATAGAQIVTNTVNGHYYEVISDPGATWISAETSALSLYYNGLEGHLATITSASEDMFVGQAVALAGPGEFWLGGYQVPANELVATAGWTWVNGEGTFPGVNGLSGFNNNYSNWNPGEPNDNYGPGSEQFLGINLGNVGGFNDEGNLGLIGGYVIEFDPNTIPTGGLVPDSSSTAALLIGSMTVLGGLYRRYRQ
jgi:hypothetical protein